jgi:hypothetical protein
MEVSQGTKRQRWKHESADELGSDPRGRPMQPPSSRRHIRASCLHRLRVRVRSLVSDSHVRRMRNSNFGLEATSAAAAASNVETRSQPAGTDCTRCFPPPVVILLPDLSRLRSLHTVTFTVPRSARRPTRRGRSERDDGRQAERKHNATAEEEQSQREIPLRAQVSNRR